MDSMLHQTSAIKNATVSDAFIQKATSTFSEGRFRDLIRILRTTQPEITIGSTPVTKISWLGSGGFKAVYDIEIEGEHYAITIPNAIHDPFVLIQNWPYILNEAENTDRMRDMGFYTNSLSKIIRININNITLPALIMHRYCDLPLEVRDNKNPVSSIGTTRILPPEVVPGAIPKYLKPFAEDIRRLIANNVHVNPESINLCVVDEQPHLYFNDLSKTKFEEIPEKLKPQMIHNYAHDAISAMTRGITEKEYKESKKYLRERHDYLVEALSSETISHMSYSV